MGMYTYVVKCVKATLGLWLARHRDIGTSGDNVTASRRLCGLLQEKPGARRGRGEFFFNYFIA